MNSREETLAILKKAFEAEDAYKLLAYFESRIPEDIATKKDIYGLKLEIEKVRADLTGNIEKVRADLTGNIEKVRADLTGNIEKVRADLAGNIEKVRADLTGNIEKVRADLAGNIEKVRADLLKWSFTFWIAQMVLLAGILFKLLSS